MNRPWIGVLGHPLTHSLSKKIQTSHLSQHHLKWDFRILDVHPSSFENEITKILDDPFCKGFSVTMPYKEKVGLKVTAADELSQSTGVINCVKQGEGEWLGFNTDGPGFLEGLWSWSLKPPLDVVVLIVGIGATAKTLSTVLAREGYQKFLFLNRTKQKALQWQDRFRVLFPHVEVSVLSWGERVPVTENLFLLNTIPIGIYSIPSPILFRSFKKNIWCFDVAYISDDTEFLRQAKEHHFHTFNGWPMFLAQAKRAFEIWVNSYRPAC